jgi:hypothetical protein
MMMTCVTHALSLTRHEQTPTDAVRSIAARVSRSLGGVLRIEFVVAGDLHRLRIPAPGPSRPVIGLWEHTCVEAFIASNADTAYHELNCAPSGEWAIFAFRGYRDIAPRPDDVTAPEITARHTPERLELDVVVRLRGLSAAYADAPLRVGLSAVIEEEDGRLSYWALRHPPGKPDFHHPDAFALTLAAPGVDSGVDPG